MRIEQIINNFVTITHSHDVSKLFHTSWAVDPANGYYCNDLLHWCKHAQMIDNISDWIYVDWLYSDVKLLNRGNAKTSARMWTWTCEEDWKLVVLSLLMLASFSKPIIHFVPAHFKNIHFETFPALKNTAPVWRRNSKQSVEALWNSCSSFKSYKVSSLWNFPWTFHWMK